MESLYSFELICKTDNKKYCITLEPDGMLVADSVSGDTIKLPRGDRPALYKMTRLPFLPVMLTINRDKKLVFRLTYEQVESITRWHGPLCTLDLAQLQKERYKWLLPIAIVLMVVSLPVLTDSAALVHNTISGYMNLGLGIFLLVIYILSSVSLTRIVFLLDFLWFIIAGVVVAIDVIIAGRYLSLVLVPLLILGAWSGMYEFRRFRGVK
ncbi:MAG TPA: hypothetical protein PK514_10125 [Spirochaetota bacterium]|nr:hypothetical protein [Spirochaetota bacterium]